MKEKLFLNNWNYNAALIINELAKVVKNNGGSVKKSNTIEIVNSSIMDHIQENELKIERILQRNTEAGKKYAETLRKEIEELKKISNNPVTVNYTSWMSSYITFIFNNIYYYYQTDSNPFFEFYYIKTPINCGEISNDAAMEEDKKDWLFDCFFKSDCSKADIKEAANIIFNMLINSSNSVILRDSRRVRVNNYYNNSYHYETVYSPERKEKINLADYEE